jgi:hypothetical protein
MLCGAWYALQIVDTEHIQPLFAQLCQWLCKVGIDSKGGMLWCAYTSKTMTPLLVNSGAYLFIERASLRCDSGLMRCTSADSAASLDTNAALSRSNLLAHTTTFKHKWG